MCSIHKRKPIEQTIVTFHEKDLLLSKDALRRSQQRAHVKWKVWKGSESSEWSMGYGATKPRFELHLCMETSSVTFSDFLLLFL